MKLSRLYEQLTKIPFKVTVDDNMTTVAAYNGDTLLGKVVFEQVFDAYELDFADFMDEDRYYRTFPGNDLIKIAHLQVEPAYRGRGLAKQLVTHGLNLMRRKGYNQFYLNASPMDRFNGLGLNELVNFYEQLGFKVLQHRGGNAMMGMVVS